MFQGLSVAKDDPEAFEYAGDIAYSPQAFRTYLTRATNSAHYDDDGYRLQNTCGAKKWTILLGPERFEGIALIKMSRMTMQLRLEGYTKAEADAFLERFLRHYQRGGG